MLHKVGGDDSLGARLAPDQPPQGFAFLSYTDLFFFLELLLEGKHLDLTVV